MWLPEDQVLLLDNCAKAIGLSRGAFMQVYVDHHVDELTNFTTGWLAANRYYQDTLKTTKQLENASQAIKNLGGGKTIVMKGH